jgi:hypothetical protein
MKKLLGFAAMAVLVLCCTGVVFATNTDNHTVTVTVDAINEIAVTGGDITLTINTATAGSDPDAQTDNTCGLLWTTNEPGKKITAASDEAAPNFTLKVLAQAVTGGTASAEATLSNTTARDVVEGVATTTGGCTLRYTASATAAQGTGTVNHTVTYTVTDAS